MKISEYFSAVSDYRVMGRCYHSLSDILGLILCGVIADCDDYSEIVDYGNYKKDFLCKELGFVFANGIPSADTLERMMRHMKTEELEKSFKICLEGLQLSGKLLNIDGKSLRGTIPNGKKQAEVQIVNVWCDEYKISFGQFQIEKKSNEIVAIPELLSKIDCEDSIITIDAMGCQKAITAKIIEKKADYVIGLKDNQKALSEITQHYMQGQKKYLSYSESHDKDHQRGEIRKVYTCACPSLIVEAEEFTALNTLIMVERTVILPKETTTQTSYYISSISNLTTQKAMEYVRGLWGIENGLHWQLDVTFKEDDSTVKKDNAPANLHFIRKWALYFLKKLEPQISIKRKRKKALYDNDFLIQILKKPLI